MTEPKHTDGKNLFTLCDDNSCEVTAGYHDQVMVDNGCYKKILRSWFVFENCETLDASNIVTHIQTIEVYDLIPPR
ncbi:MAG: hypothetical protein R2771_07350 [Saprospiraceae bacterium]